MPYHSHTLNSSTHSHIIGRTDPITGDTVKENDKVVFCAVCKSCFLEESWKYMNEQHCEQTQTLGSVPALSSKLTIKNRSKEMITELRNQGINFNIVVATCIFSFLIPFFGLSTSNAFDIKSAFTVSLWITGLLSILSALLTSTESFKELVGNTKNNIRIFRNRIEIGKDSFSWNDIRQIKYQREMNHDYVLDTPCLLIYFENGKFLKKSLPTKSYKKTAVFLNGLEKISHFKDVFFYSESYVERATMINIQTKSDGKIEIGKRRR